jgi:hypothetical protein
MARPDPVRQVLPELKTCTSLHGSRNRCVTCPDVIDVVAYRKTGGNEVWLEPGSELAYFPGNSRYKFGLISHGSAVEAAAGLDQPISLDTSTIDCVEK